MERLMEFFPGGPGWGRANFWLPAAACLAAGQAGANDIQWGNINGGGFNTGGNWIGGVVPGAGDFARFGRTRDPDQQAAYTVTFSSSPSNLGVVIEDDRVTFDLNGNAYSLGDSTAMLVGTSTNVPGRLTLTDGIVATAPDAQVRIGASPNASGFLTLSGGGQLFGPSVLVGFGAPGTLVVQGGADIVGGPMLVGSQGFTEATGTATITGPGSAVVVEDLAVGGAGSGTLNITAGGRIESTTGIIGKHSLGTGRVNVDGAGSSWTSSSDVFVGSQGQAELSITSGARVEFRSAQVGLDGPGTVGVSGHSELMVQIDLSVGNRGLGSVNISGGGLVQSSAATLGVIAPGSAAVEGAGSRWICSTDMTVCGGTGTGALEITGGAEVHSTDGYIARFSGIGDVSVSGAGSTWTMTDDLSVGGDFGAGVNGGSASLVIGPGGTVNVDSIFIFPGDTVDLHGGTLDASRIFKAIDSTGQLLFHSGILRAGEVGLFLLLNQGGTLAPGHSAGGTSIAGDYTQQAAGTMEIEIGGTTPITQFDKVFVGGTATLGGVLDLRLINGFVPSSGQTFVVLDAADVVGAFANVASGQRLVTSDGRGSFVVHYGAGSAFDPTTIVLSDFGACKADFNGDGARNVFDFLAFQTAFGNGDLGADFDGNGVLNVFDFLAFQTAFAEGC